MARHYRMHGLAGIKEDAMEIGAVGVGAVAGVVVAKAVTGWVAGQSWTKDDKGATAMWAQYVNALLPAAVGLGVIYGANKAALRGAARQAALGVAGGMVAVSVAKVVTAISEPTAKSLMLTPLAGVDTYDSGLLAGLGEMDASVARYMMAGSPTQVQTLMGAPIQVQAFAGAPTQVQALAGAPMSATLM
jgi:hypothetical protein